MSESSSSHTKVSSKMTAEDDTKLLWQHATKNERLNGGGGNIAWQWNFCQEHRKGSYTRVGAHLLKLGGYGIGVCKKATSKDLAKMQKLEDEAKAQILKNAPKQVPLPPSQHMQTETHSFRTGSTGLAFALAANNALSGYLPRDTKRKSKCREIVETY